VLFCCVAESPISPVPPSPNPDAIDSTSTTSTCSCPCHTPELLAGYHLPLLNSFIIKKSWYTLTSCLIYRIWSWKWTSAETSNVIESLLASNFCPAGCFLAQYFGLDPLSDDVIGRWRDKCRSEAVIGQILWCHIFETLQIEIGIEHSEGLLWNGYLERLWAVACQIMQIIHNKYV
jgi:hypothetical protein